MSNNSERMILVTGATGQQGGAVHQHLRKNGFKLRALVRDPNSNKARRLMGQGGEVFQGSLDDPHSLMRAMEGVYGVFSVQPYTANEIQQGAAVIEAAKRQGACHLVYTSVGSANEKTGIPHFESKARVEEHNIDCGYRNSDHHFRNSMSASVVSVGRSSGSQWPQPAMLSPETFSANSSNMAMIVWP